MPIVMAMVAGVIANRDQCPAIPYTPEEYAANTRIRDRTVLFGDGAAAVGVNARAFVDAQRLFEERLKPEGVARGERELRASLARSRSIRSAMRRRMRERSPEGVRDHAGKGEESQRDRPFLRS